MALKRGLLTEQISSSFPEELERIVSFVVDCLQNNNNVVLIKALKITSELLKWSSASSVHNHKKAIATQVLTNLDRLTSTEKELAR
jgi:galactose-1-phosphate uridylyltransferase